jgi:predicted negative regulator of RcsB-dependent stress response
MVEEVEPQFAEDEDLERAKAFWKENGRSIISGIVLGVLAIGGYNGWQYWQKTQGENASTLYENMQDASITYEAAAAIAKDLKDDYGATPYATGGALLMAKRNVENGALSEAGSQLEWVLSNSKDIGLQHVARIRLAMIRLAESDADGVLVLVDEYAGAGSETEFVSRYLELKGDAHAAKGEIDAARAAYSQAHESLPASALNETLLKLKLDNLGNF